MRFYDITRTVYRVGDFVDWQRSGTLELSPSFQRRSVWRPIEKSYLIDTIVRGFPTPPIFLRDVAPDLETYSARRQVVDGQQRIRTLVSFVAPEALPDFDPERDEFVVRQSHNPEIADVPFGLLTDEYKARILDYQFPVHVFPSDTGDPEILQIFARMNSGGVKLSNQELRNAEFTGEFKNTMYELAAEQLDRWRSWGVFSEQEIARMEEVELISEFVYFMRNGISGKNRNALDSLYREFDDEFPQRAEISKRVRAVMGAIEKELGDDLADTAFSRKTLIYPLLAAVYTEQFGLQSRLARQKAESVSLARWRWFRAAGMMMASGDAPTELIEEIGRRTTHPATRQAIFEYLIGDRPTN